MDDKRARQTLELNLHICGLPPIADPSAVGYSFLTDQLGNSDITLDRCWLGPNETLFIWFLSLSNRLWALRAKRKLFPLPTKIYLHEDLKKCQMVELKHSRSLVDEARHNGKWTFICNLMSFIHDSPPSSWILRQAPKVA